MMTMYLADTADTDLKQMCEVGGNLCVTSGIDKVKYVNPSSGASGDAGFDLLKDYWNAPTFNSEGVGSLDASKWYAIVIKPVSTYLTNPNTGGFMEGTITHYSDPVQPSGVSKSLIFDMPDLTDQKLVFAAGIMIGGDPGMIIDSERTWDDDVWVGYSVMNAANGEIALITGNDSVTLSVDADISPASGNGYHIIKPFITGYEVYGIEMNAATDIAVGQYTLIGTGEAEDLQFTMSSFSGGGLTAIDNNFPPDPYSACVTADNKMIAGGGVLYSDGEAEVDTSSYPAIASVAYPVSITTTAQYAQVAGTSGDFDQIMRYTFPDASQYIPQMRRGSVVSITASEDSENDLDNVVITNCAENGSWFEVINSGVNNADDEVMQIIVVRNVLVGNVSGENQTYFGTGMVNARFKFKSDGDSYRIIWVDPYAQEIGFSAEYIGQSTGTGRIEPRPVTWPVLANPDNYALANTGGIALNGSFTISFWYNRALETSRRIVSAGNNAETDMFLSSMIGDTRLDTSFVIGGSNKITNFELPGGASGLFPADEWHHFAYVHDVGNEVAAYYDGSPLDVQFSFGGAITDIGVSLANSKLVLGAEFLDSSYNAVKFFNTALSASEIETVYGGFSPSGLLEEWVCDDGSGDLCAASIGAVPLENATMISGFLNYTLETGMSWVIDFDWGLPVIINDDGFSIYSDYGLAWSDANHPHIFRTENSTPISDRITAIAAFNQTIILFCQNSVQAVPIAGLGQNPYLISDDVQCSAPHSIVSTPSGVFFYDGTGISLTDGQQIIPVTAYRAADYLGYINNAKTDNIRGVFDPQNRRIEYYFAYGDEDNNNFGLTISTDSLNCYPSQRLDVNAAWLDRNDTGDQVIIHGSTDEISDGTLWVHGKEISTDGGYEQELVGNLIALDTPSRTISLDFGEPIDEGITLAPGDTCMYLPTLTGEYFQFRIKEISVDGIDPNVYHIVVEDSIDFDTFELTDTVIVGGIPVDYGVKWTDFSSPQYKHNVRQLQLDVTNFNGILFVEHYRDMSEVPVSTTSHYVNTDTTKVVSVNKNGDCYTYGFRIYGISMTKFEFHSFEVLFDTEQ